VIAAHVLAALILVAAAAYAQHRVRFHTAGRRRVLLARGVLAAVGVALGYVLASYAPDGALSIVAFVEGFGLVHFPAAVILFLKRARGEARS
jgi:hypothetical protein